MQTSELEDDDVCIYGESEAMANAPIYSVLLSYCWAGMIIVRISIANCLLV